MVELPGAFGNHGYHREKKANIHSRYKLIFPP
jgi:hypothetical protein